MPNATVSIDAERIDLKTLPDGYVSIKRMPYGKWLQRTEMAMTLSLQMGKNDGKGTTGTMEMANRKVTEFEFKQCIVEHNLTNAGDEPLDFNKSFTLDMLDPKIGNEIAAAITALHEFEAELPN